MIRTGVDWSGDPGDPRRNEADSGWLILVGCHLADEDSDTFTDALIRLKRKLGLQEDHVFKYLKSTASTRQRYFEMLRTTKLRASALCIDKRSWSDEYLRRSNGPQRIIDALVELAQSSADSDVAGQVLLIDTKRADKRFLSDLRRDLRSSLRLDGRASFKKIVPRPDDRADAYLIQAADMIAGDLRRHGGLNADVQRCLEGGRLKMEVRG